MNLHIRPYRIQLLLAGLLLASGGIGGFIIVSHGHSAPSKTVFTSTPSQPVQVLSATTSALPTVTPTSPLGAVSHDHSMSPHTTLPTRTRAPSPTPMARAEDTSSVPVAPATISPTPTPTPAPTVDMTPFTATMSEQEIGNYGTGKIDTWSATATASKSIRACTFRAEASTGEGLVGSGSISGNSCTATDGTYVASGIAIPIKFSFLLTSEAGEVIAVGYNACNGWPTASKCFPTH